jgi:hypothetical protein
MLSVFSGGTRCLRLLKAALANLLDKSRAVGVQSPLIGAGPSHAVCPCVIWGWMGKMLLLLEEDRAWITEF